MRKTRSKGPTQYVSDFDFSVPNRAVLRLGHSPLSSRTSVVRVTDLDLVIKSRKSSYGNSSNMT